MAEEHENIKAMVLAAGTGSRLRPLTLKRAKAMLPIGGRPLLEHLTCLLKVHNITEIAINLHYRPDDIVEYFGDGHAFGVRITYSREQELLGTAGAVKKLQHFFTETFLVVYGDLLTTLDLTALVDFHWRKGGLATIALYRVDHPQACGIVELDTNGRIRRFVEKPGPEEVFGNLANAGIYVLEPEVIDFIPAGVFYDFGHDLFPLLLEHGMPLYGYPIRAYLIDIGTLEKYKQAQRDRSRAIADESSWSRSEVPRSP